MLGNDYIYQTLFSTFIIFHSCHVSAKLTYIITPHLVTPMSTQSGLRSSTQKMPQHFLNPSSADRVYRRFQIFNLSLAPENL